MWPQGFTLSEIFIRKIRQFRLLNNIKQSPEGLAFSGLKYQIGSKVSTRVYRILKKLEDDGYLAAQTTLPSSERLKQHFILTPKRIQKLQELKVSHGMQARFPEETEDINVPEFLEKGTFHHFRTPAEFILQNDSIPCEKNESFLLSWEK